MRPRRPNVVVRTPLLLGTLLAALLAAVLPALSATGAEAAVPREGIVTRQGTVATTATRPSGTALIDHARFGAFVDGMTRDPSRLDARQTQLGAPISVASYFYGFGDEFPSTLERTFSAGGRRDVLLSWDMGTSRFTDWSGGAHDAYLRRIGTLAAAYGSPVYVRPWPEMNADWVPFQPTLAGSKPSGGTPAQFVAAWRHVVTTIRAAGGTNIRWVFNPTVDTYAETTDVRTIWPGAAYVDVLGLDGYNWGQDSSWGRWKSFTDIFSAQYARLTSLHPTAPVWVCEFASKEPSYNDGAPADPAHDKGAWITDALSTTAFPRITVLSWFDIKKERDWRWDSSPASAAALTRMLSRQTTPRTRSAPQRAGTQLKAVRPLSGLTRVVWRAGSTPRPVRQWVVRAAAQRSGLPWTRVGSVAGWRRSAVLRLPARVSGGVPRYVVLTAVDASGRSMTSSPVSPIIRSR